MKNLLLKLAVIKPVVLPKPVILDGTIDMKAPKLKFNIAVAGPLPADGEALPPKVEKIKFMLYSVTMGERINDIIQLYEVCFDGRTAN